MSGEFHGQLIFATDAAGDLLVIPKYYPEFDLNNPFHRDMKAFEQSIMQYYTSGGFESVDDEAHPADGTIAVEGGDA
jgi:hypothetical protein